MNKNLPLKNLILFLILLSVALSAIFYTFFLIKDKIVTKISLQNKTKLNCPVVKSFCLKGIILYDSKGNYGGIGYSLPNDSPIFAVFKGKAKSSTTTFIKDKITYPGIALTKQTNDLEAVYIFNGIEYKHIANDVKESQILSKVKTGQIEDFKNINLIISFYRIVNERSKSLLNIKPNELN